VSPVKYELGFYIPEDDILHSHCREDLKSYKCASYPKVCNVGIIWYVFIFILFQNAAVSGELVPRRVRIFDGGFESNEDYIYVRGRGW
jgi:hypothetical protein